MKPTPICRIHKNMNVLQGMRYIKIVQEVRSQARFITGWISRVRMG